MERELIRIDRNGTKYWKTKPICNRCGGSGVWTNGLSKGICYGCRGEGYKIERIVKEYTPEHEAKLEKRRIERANKKAKEIAKKTPVKIPKIKQTEIKGNHIGGIGEKVELDVIYEDYKSWETPFGWQGIYILRDLDGNLITWKTSSYLGSEVIRGNKIRIKATIKEHVVNSYKNEKETHVQRVKILD